MWRERENFDVNSQGDLLVGVSGGDVAFRKPVVYQEFQGQRREVKADYKLESAATV